MENRIKALRKALNLTQAEFAARIGLRQNSIALVESGKRNISDQATLSICREFNSSEKWLRTGEGEMFTEVPETELDALCQRHDCDDLDRKIIETYLKLDAEGRAGIKKYIRAMSLVENR